MGENRTEHSLSWDTLQKNLLDIGYWWEAWEVVNTLIIHKRTRKVCEQERNWFTFRK